MSTFTPSMIATATFLEAVINLWRLLNCKSPIEHIGQRDSDRIDVDGAVELDLEDATSSSDVPCVSVEVDPQILEKLDSMFADNAGCEDKKLVKEFTCSCKYSTSVVNIATQGISVHQQLCRGACHPVTGAHPGIERDDLKLLPTSCTKAFLYRKYAEACSASPTERAVCENAFMQIWRQCLPHILPMKPLTDLCWTCQKNTVLLGRLTSMPEEQKLEVLQKATDHVNHAAAERTTYKDAVQDAKVS
ncbi:hypothetical protein ElyMa_002783300 [Elysia marginata]|uniref:Uncharacterized protein n=1 Tax=Elysia marginata TaxID=1093978 RepID=A0AAV4HR12_9GAST|nr:hypothetical protein ElyMa_002783300 [Elysia marginata]